MKALTAYVRTLNPELPRSVQTLQLGGVFNAFGNGLVLPFAFIYLHNVRGIGLGTAGLILATNAAVSMVVGPVFGSLVDRFGGRRMLGVALCFLAAGFGALRAGPRPLAAASSRRRSPASATAASGPAQSTLIAGLTTPEQRPAAYAMQRVVMNLGIGLGGVAGGFIATHGRAGHVPLLFLGNAATFLVYLAVLRRLRARAGASAHGARRAARPLRGRRSATARSSVVLGLNTLFIFAGIAGLRAAAASTRRTRPGSASRRSASSTSPTRW